MDPTTAVVASPPASSRPAQRIIPTLPLDSEGFEVDNATLVDDSYGDMSDLDPPSIVEDAGSHGMTETVASYSIPPAPQRIVPAESFQDLYEPMEDSSEAESGSRLSSPSHVLQGEEEASQEGVEASEYLPGFRPYDETSASGPRVAASSQVTRNSTSSEPLAGLPGSFHFDHPLSAAQQSASSRGREGETSTSAIVIQDSPTPPLRPLASPQARLAASITGKCGVLASMEPSTNSPALPIPEDQTSTLAELVCPICLGSPSPLVITECGHTL